MMHVCAVWATRADIECDGIFGRRHSAPRQRGRGRSVMKKLIAALALLPLLPLGYSAATAQNAPQGDAAKGKANWENRACLNCHGGVGEAPSGPISPDAD